MPTARRAAVLGAALFALACALPGIGLFRDPGRVGPFQQYGDRVLAGQIPYRDFSLEYPPGALPPLVVPSFGPASDYGTWFMAFELACGLATVVLVAVALGELGTRGPRLYLSVAFVALAPLALGPLTLHRFDLWAVALCTGGLAAVLAGRPRLALASLAAGTAAKLFPVVLVPLALAYVARRQGRAAARQALWVYLGVGAAIVAPFLALGPGGVRFSLARQLGRALQIETLGASLLLVLHELGSYRPTSRFGDGSWNLVGGLPDAVAALQTVLQVAAVLAVWILFARGRRRPGELAVGAAAALAVWVLLGKVLSPQFMLWLLPVVVLVRLAWAPAVLLAAFGLTQAVYPDRYDALVRFEATPVALLAARNGLLVLLAAALLQMVDAPISRARMHAPARLGRSRLDR